MLKKPVPKFLFSYVSIEVHSRQTWMPDIWMLNWQQNKTDKEERKPTIFVSRHKLSRKKNLWIPCETTMNNTSSYTYNVPDRKCY